MLIKKNFFNIDFHISVIADIKNILESIGHDVVDRTLSQLAWAINKKVDQDILEIINTKNLRDIDDIICDKFYEKYKYELSKYDGFIVTHTPCLAMLFERWKKPIIVMASTRYENPFVNNKNKWDKLNEFILDQYKKGLLITVSNNKFDSEYAKLFTGINWEVIPSLCEYTNMSYRPSNENILYWSKYKYKQIKQIITDKDELKPNKIQRIINKLPLFYKKYGYSWGDIESYKAIFHIPYNISIMSLTEQYTANIPLIFPSKKLLLDLYKNNMMNGVLSEISFNQVYGVPTDSYVSNFENDPNYFYKIEMISKWIDLADFYDQEYYPYITYINDLDDIYILNSNINFSKISDLMKEFNIHKKEIIKNKWTALINEHF